MKIKRLTLAFFIGFGVFLATHVRAQVEHKWLALGSLHNFYASFGTEIEEGFIKRQQAGLAWPGIYDFQDAQAAKSMWIGVKDFTDENGNFFPYKVVHSGPRVRGDAFFFPVEYKLVSKAPPTEVYVDGNLTFKLEQTVDTVDPSIPGDRMIYAKFNTAIGITVERKVHQFSQQYHDNYHIFEITLTNTGYINRENVQRLNAPVTGLFFHEQARWAPILQTRYTIGNATGWGINTMNDRRGDGLNSSGDPTENEFKAQYAWHGRFVGFSPPIAGATDNLGAPIIVPSTVGGLLSAADTTGRLGAYHFVGKVHIHADTSPTDTTNDPNQPYTMDEIGSDDPLNSQNDPFNVTRMTAEYERMSIGRTPRHAYKVEPTGEAGFLAPTGDPSLGTSGGWSAATGYGPYTLQPGESIKIVYAEAVSGIGHAYAREVGARYKREVLDPNISPADAALNKNRELFKGRDSLFQTFRRAIANYKANFKIKKAPDAPSYVEVNSTGAGIEILWEYNGDESLIDGFEIYRSAYLPDSTAKLVAKVDPSVREFFDDENTPAPAGPPIRGIDYYYYITAVGKDDGTTDNALTPPGPLRSSRYYTQTYDPARLLRPPGEKLDEIRIVPNPYIDTSADALRFGRDTRIGFFEVPGKCSIKIFTEIGEFIKELKGNNSGDVYWDLMTQSRQRIASGIYIAVIKNLDPASSEYGKEVIKKFVVIF